MFELTRVKPAKLPVFACAEPRPRMGRDAEINEGDVTVAAPDRMGIHVGGRPERPDTVMRNAPRTLGQHADGKPALLPYFALERLVNDADPS